MPVEIEKEADVYSIATKLEAKLNAEERSQLVQGLLARWRNRDKSTTLIESYKGPQTKNGILSNIVASIVLEEAGIVLQVADSTILDGGRGLFIRALEEPFLFRKGDVVCGYAFGTTDHGTSPTDAKLHGAAVTMAFTAPQQRVFFDGYLNTVGNLLQNGYAAATEPALFIPTSPQPSLEIMNLGHTANDLSWNTSILEISSDLYQQMSSKANVLALVGRLERLSNPLNLASPSILSFTRPIVVSRFDLLIDNYIPMELGVEYGYNYWAHESGLASTDASIK
eukprot:CAMPEP_0197294488 /NCGR_PEP_ID=MMETSP0890-20130614/32611_1 /TAXON_ID=44058 ORGANISM="Aureoumbra lagunensis, Strain CCMP1510" /NCGR_SAMPLE_ID=MMETSP0890 /ASSEMBLY_ACC=CAM_ASM_000533 /LENGTH=281 /DNA_ID=CAMNT_0042769923 /DNA_START=228 /DNA_END=1073 /DNA_ORIENTATION=+